MKDETKRLEEWLRMLEPPYKLRGEAQVGRLLDRYEIPFFYELPLLINDRGRDRIWYPSFMLPTYSRLIVEYVGTPVRPDYMEGIDHKQRAYDRNGISALFIYPEDLTGSRWDETLVDRIKHLGQTSSVPPQLDGRYGQPATSRPR